MDKMPGVWAAVPPTPRPAPSQMSLPREGGPRSGRLRSCLLPAAPRTPGKHRRGLTPRSQKPTRHSHSLCPRLCPFPLRTLNGHTGEHRPVGTGPSTGTSSVPFSGPPARPSLGAGGCPAAPSGWLCSPLPCPARPAPAGRRPLPPRRSEHSRNKTPKQRRRWTVLGTPWGCPAGPDLDHR